MCILQRKLVAICQVRFSVCINKKLPPVSKQAKSAIMIKTEMAMHAVQQIFFMCYRSILEYHLIM